MTDNTQPEALRLAEILEGDYCPDWFYEQGVDEVAAELRRQHTRIAELQSELEAVGAGGVQALSAAPAIKPLVWSDESGPTDKIRYNHITAETALGQFSVEWKGWKEEDGPCVYLAGDYIGVASNLGGAKQLAERHIRELVANLLAAPAEQQAAPKAAPGELSADSLRHQNKLLAETLGACILASGIVRKDIDGFTGPELLHFGEDLRSMLEAAPQPAPAPLSEREAFERDWGKRHAPVTINGRTRDDGRYGDSSIQDAWESWQARAALAAQGGKDA